MRISLCFRRSGTDFRLVWLNESKNGIYLGVLGSKEESHFSYHEDGRRHVKIGSDYHLPSNDIPISDWRGVRQLHHLSMSMSKEWFSAATAYAGDEKTETVVLLDESVFGDCETCALDVWILDRASEPKLFEIVAKHVATDKRFRMVTEVVAALDHFPDHKIALTLRVGRVRNVADSPSTV